MSTNNIVFDSPHDIHSALVENRGRYPRKPNQNTFKETLRNNAWRALVRIKRIATDQTILQSHPRLSFEANQWLVEMAEGKPSIQIDQRVTGHIVIAPDDLVIIDAVNDDTQLLTTSYSVIDAQDSKQGSVVNEDGTETSEDSQDMGDDINDVDGETL
jgi:hypothetical protein